jgi:hypothetical protein
MMSAEPYSLELKNPENANETNYKNSGTLIVDEIKLLHTEPPGHPAKDLLSLTTSKEAARSI